MDAVKKHIAENVDPITEEFHGVWVMRACPWHLAVRFTNCKSSVIQTLLVLVAGQCYFFKHDQEETNDDFCTSVLLYRRGGECSKKLSKRFANE